MPRIEAVGTALPKNVVTQEQARAECEKLYAGDPKVLRLLRVFDSGVKTRHFAFPPDYYLAKRSFEERNADYVEQGTALAESAARSCLAQAGVEPGEVDHLFFVTTTGLATPSVDALLAPRLGLRKEARRWPLFGLGCAAGAGGLIRAGELLEGRPKQRALVVSVELCGQVFALGARSPTDVVGAALFGDGAAAVLLSGDDVPGPGPRIEAAHTELFEESKHIMGWDFTSDGMRLVLSKDVCDLVNQRLRPVVEKFVRSAGLALRSFQYWILHPGGRRIIDAYRETFECDERLLRWTRDSLSRVGNLSSASVLFTLKDVLDEARPSAGEKGIMVALGPGFATEMLVLGW
jgi:alkylresorcinol/alkylpyrone synthase